MIALSGLHKLRSLSCNLPIIHSPTLMAVAQLPNLTDLSISGNPDSQNDLLWDLSWRDRIPPGSFPALKSLTVDLGTSYNTEQFFKFLPLTGLNGVNIILAQGDLQFISTLCRASPQLTDLDILHFNGIDHEDEEIMIGRISSGLFEHLSRLPMMQSFELDGAILDFPDVWRTIARAWPNIREINCIGQVMQLEDLQLISSGIPNLRRIKCKFDFENAVRTVERRWRPTGNTPSYPELKYMCVKRVDGLAPSA